VKAILIIGLVVVVLFGGLLILRTSRGGMPDAETLDRASKRAREQADNEKKEDGGDA